MDGNADGSLAQHTLSFAGKSLAVVGIAGIAVGSIYAIHELTGGALNLIDYAISRMKADDQNDDDSVTWNDFQTNAANKIGKYTKVALIVIGAVVVKKVGTTLEGPNASNALNTFLGYTTDKHN